MTFASIAEIAYPLTRPAQMTDGAKEFHRRAPERIARNDTDELTKAALAMDDWGEQNRPILEGSTAQDSYNATVRKYNEVAKGINSPSARARFLEARNGVIGRYMQRLYGPGAFGGGAPQTPQYPADAPPGPWSASGGANMPFGTDPAGQSPQGTAGTTHNDGSVTYPVAPQGHRFLGIPADETTQKREQQKEDTRQRYAGNDWQQNLANAMQMVAPPGPWTPSGGGALPPGAQPPPQAPQAGQEGQFPPNLMAFAQFMQSMQAQQQQRPPPAYGLDREGAQDYLQAMMLSNPELMMGKVTEQLTPPPPTTPEYTHAVNNGMLSVYRKDTGQRLWSEFVPPPPKGNNKGDGKTPNPWKAGNEEAQAFWNYFPSQSSKQTLFDMGQMGELLRVMAEYQKNPAAHKRTLVNVATNVLMAEGFRLGSGFFATAVFRDAGQMTNNILQNFGSWLKKTLTGDLSDVEIKRIAYTALAVTRGKYASLAKLPPFSNESLRQRFHNGGKGAFSEYTEMFSPTNREKFLEVRDKPSRSEKAASDNVRERLAQSVRDKYMVQGGGGLAAYKRDLLGDITPGSAALQESMVDDLWNAALKLDSQEEDEGGIDATGY